MDEPHSAPDIINKEVRDSNRQGDGIKKKFKEKSMCMGDFVINSFGTHTYAEKKSKTLENDAMFC